LESLKDQFQILCNAAIEIGENSHKDIYEENISEEILENQTILFVWMEKAKQFLILWRDVQLENQKAQVYQLSNKLNAGILDKQLSQSKQIILDANDELSKVLDDKLEEIKTKKNGEKKHIEKWNKQESPWDTYKEQLKQLLEQSNLLFEENRIINDSYEKLNALKDVIHSSIIKIEESVSETFLKIENATVFITENESKAAIAKYIDKKNPYIEDEIYLRKLSQSIDGKINEFEDRSQVACGTYGGVIQFKEISWKKSVRQWVESEILPQIYEMWELKDAIGGGLNMTFVNIKNRALLQSNENIEMNSEEDFLLPLNNFKKKIKKTEDSILELKEKINNRIQNDLLISNIYENVEFLNIPLQSTINQLRLDQNELLERAKGWWKKQWSHVTGLRNSIKEEEALGISEKVVRCIQSKTIKTNNSQYSNIFLTKGYIGESFWVGRKKEIEQIKTNISNWRDGYRGAVILSGQRLSGKSIFGELVCSKYFRGEVVRLQPDSSIFIQGRQLKTTYNLADALE
ncbi:MAG: ATP-binding protein, partial [Saprospiraceae bacterium]